MEVLLLNILLVTRILGFDFPDTTMRKIGGKLNESTLKMSETCLKLAK